MNLVERFNNVVVATTAVTNSKDVNEIFFILIFTFLNENCALKWHSKDEWTSNAKWLLKWTKIRSLEKAGLGFSTISSWASLAKD